MMTFFPIPYKDEILYSVLGRYHIRSGNTSLKSTLEDVFRKTSVTAVMDLPSHINRIIENMPVGSKYSSEYFIDKHTFYPLYAAFLTPKHAKDIKNFMKGEKGGSIYNKIGLMASSITLNQYFKFCPECIKEDKESYGELYWHRVHQVSGVLVCPKHKVLLQDSEVPVRGVNKHEYKVATFENCKENTNYISLSDATIEKLKFLAEDVEVVMTTELDNRSLDWFKDQYINRLKEMGFANVNGRINQKDFAEKFVDYYGDKFLKIVQSDLDIHGDFNWLTNIVRRKNRTSHPIRHLLLMRFLGISIYDLFNKKLEYKPFGDGPWPCLNPASNHYLKNVISQVKIKYSSESKSPLGTFTCSCGFSYIRRGPDLTEAAKYEITKIKEYGHVWESKLIELVERKLSLRETARQLKVDPATVKKHVKRLWINPCWECSSSKECVISVGNISKDDIKKKKQNYRQEWLQLMSKHPKKGKTELRQINNALYTWLSRNDNEWLNQNSPAKKSIVNVNLRVDWTSRDKEILEKVKEVVNDILNSEERPRKISISLVGSKLGIRGILQQHLDKLPKTNDFLDSVKESNRDFQIRRIKWAVRELEKEGQELKEWKILRKAGIRKEYVEPLKEVLRNLIE